MQYLLCLGHTIRARYHTGTAVALAHIHGLGGHSTTNNPFPASISTGLPFSDFRVVRARDDLSSSERVRLFWTVFVLDTCWGAALKVPFFLSDTVDHGAQINTPLSAQLGVSHRIMLIVTSNCSDGPKSVQAFASGPTVQRLFSGEVIVESDSSWVKLRAKVSAIYRRAVDLSGRSLICRFGDGLRLVSSRPTAHCYFGQVGGSYTCSNNLGGHAQSISS